MLTSEIHLASLLGKFCSKDIFPFTRLRTVFHRKQEAKDQCFLLCKTCRSLYPNKTVFHLFTSQKEMLEDAQTFCKEIKELTRHVGQVFPFHLDILFVTCHSSKVRKVSNHCKEEMTEKRKRKD